MIQIFTLIAGVVALVMGLNSLFKGEIQLSKTKTISGTSAQIVSGLILILGFAIIGFALIGLPFVLRQL